MPLARFEEAPDSSREAENLPRNRSWGGRRLGAGRKPVPDDERYVRVGVKLPPGLAKDLDQWQAMGYPSRSQAIQAAIDLWAGLWDAGIWRSNAECMNMAAEPLRLLARRLDQLAKSPPELIDAKRLSPEADKESTRKEGAAKK